MNSVPRPLSLRERTRRKKAQEAVERTLDSFVSKKPGWECIEIMRLESKKSLTSAEKKTLRSLRRTLEQQARDFSRTNRVPRCTCKGKFKIPSQDCPMHRRIGK